MYVCMNVCMHACMYVCIYIFVLLLVRSCEHVGAERWYLLAIADNDTLKTHGLHAGVPYLAWFNSDQVLWDGNILCLKGGGHQGWTPHRTEVDFQSAMDFDHMLSSRSKNLWDVSKILFFLVSRCFKFILSGLGIRIYNFCQTYLDFCSGGVAEPPFSEQWCMDTMAWPWTLGTFASWDVPQPDQGPFTAGTERKRFEEWRI